MSAVRRVMGRWSGLPRAARWGVLAGVALAAYFAVVEPGLDRMNAVASRADRLEARVEEAARRERDRPKAVQEIALGMTRFGGVVMPGDSASGTSAVLSRIDEILTSRDVADWSVQTRRPESLGRGVLEELIDGDTQQVRRVVFDLELTALPEVVIEVLSDLERTAEVTAVREVEIRRLNDDEPMVRATIAPETWVVAARDPGGGR